MANYTITFKEKKEVAQETFAFWFTRPADFTYEAGQYVALVLPKLKYPDKRGPVRSFSIASAPAEDDLMFAMRDTNSGFKDTFMELEPGETAQITKAIGHFTLANAADGHPIVFIVGGIGITPVRSILKQAESEGSGREFSLFYSNRKKADAAFYEEIKNMKLAGLKVIPTCSQEEAPCTGPNEERGYIDEPMLLRHLKTESLLENWYYLVGAPVFIEAMKSILGGLGVPKERIVLDPFTGLTTATQAKMESASN
ncbi:MAG: FAD-dependent oxidoreductase [Candidatus Moraniibacteriota bacterium]